MNNLKTKEVLLVEDNEDDIFLTKEAFKENKLPNKLNVVKTGIEALKYLQKEGPYSNVARPNVVLLDLNLPELSGFEVLKEIKNSENLKDIPVVILSTSSLERDIEKCYKLCANCYIKKSVNLDDFFEAINVFGKFWLSVATLPCS